MMKAYMNNIWSFKKYKLFHDFWGNLEEVETDLQTQQTVAYLHIQKPQSNININLESSFRAT